MGSLILVVVLLASYVIGALPFAGVFAKAGRPAWAAFVPVYNTLTLLDIVSEPSWWLALYLIPFVNIYVTIVVLHRLSKSFGHDTPFTVGLVLLSWIFLMILWLGPSQYTIAGTDPSGADQTPLSSLPSALLFQGIFGVALLTCAGFGVAAIVKHNWGAMVFALMASLVMFVFLLTVAERRVR